MSERTWWLLAILVLTAAPALGAPPSQALGPDVVAAADTYRRANEHRIVGELLEFLRIPNVASDGPNIRPDAQVERLRAHVREQGFHIVDEEPDAATRAAHPLLIKVSRGEFGYPASRTSMDLPISRAVIERLRDSFGIEPVATPTIGGSVPLYAFTETLGVPTIIVPTVNHDNNQHAPNENIRIENLWRGIEILAALLTL